MRKSAVLLASVALTVLLASGVALAATFRGTDGDDRIVGTTKADQIFGLGGKDDLEGRGGGDVIHAGPGNDTGSGDSGNDTIYLGPGNDGASPPPPPCPPDCTGGGFRPYDYAGGLGKDVIYGGEGDDEMSGDRIFIDGSDTEGGADIIYGEDGNDTMDGDAGSNTLYGGNGNDSIGTNNFVFSEVWYGGAGDDFMLRIHTYAVSGSEVAERDIFHGGAGDDRFLIEAFSRKGDIYYAGDGNDWLRVGPVKGSGEHRVYCGDGYDTVTYDDYDRDGKELVAHDCEEVRRR
jgi:Ca2+-binding RTX toxin-like protein